MAIDHHLPLITLFREAFEGRPVGQPFTWFVEKTEGIFDALERTSASQASTSPAPGVNTIGAHLNHVCYTLSLTNAHIRGEQPVSDWEGSWTQQTFDEEAWRQLGSDLRREYDGVLKFLETRPDWPEQDWLMGATALVPHMAYHLGAIRQLIKLV